MNKKVIRACALAAMATIAMTSCNQSNPQMDQKSQTSTSASGVKIAYVEVDSIMNQYQFAKDYSLILQKKGQNIQNTLGAKQQQLQPLISSRRYSRMPIPVSRQKPSRLACSARIRIFRL